jgi:hypothetical protein
MSDWDQLNEKKERNCGTDQDQYYFLNVHRVSLKLCCQPAIVALSFFPDRLTWHALILFSNYCKDKAGG